MIMDWMLAASLGEKAFGLIQAYQGTKAEGKAYQQSAAYNLQRLKNEQSKLDMQEKLNISDAKKRFNKIMGAQQVGYAYAGVTSEGTPTQVMMESAREAEEQLTRMRWEANMQRQALQSEAAKQMSLSAEGRSIEGNAFLETLLTGVPALASSAANSYSKYQLAQERQKYLKSKAYQEAGDPIDLEG
jgi:hypothetical protein